MYSTEVLISITRVNTAKKLLLRWPPRKGRGFGVICEKTDKNNNVYMKTNIQEELLFFKKASWRLKSSRRAYKFLTSALRVK